VQTALAAVADPETAGNLKLQAANGSGCLIGAPSIFEESQNTKDKAAQSRAAFLRFAFFSNESICGGRTDGLQFFLHSLVHLDLPTSLKDRREH
jgi:hypothetical protein